MIQFASIGLKLVSFWAKYWQIIAIGGLIAIAALKIYNAGYDSAVRECDESRKVLNSRIDAEKARREKVTKEYEEKLLKLNPTKEIIRNNTIREIEKPVYKECVIPKTGQETVNTNADLLNEMRKEEKIDPSLLEKIRSALKGEK